MFAGFRQRKAFRFGAVLDIVLDSRLLHAPRNTAQAILGNRLSLFPGNSFRLLQGFRFGLFGGGQFRFGGFLFVAGFL